MVALLAPTAQLQTQIFFQTVITGCMAVTRMLTWAYTPLSPAPLLNALKSFNSCLVIFPRTGFELLSMDLASLQSALPSASAAASPKDSGAVKQLRSLMQQVEAIKNEREATESELKSATSDMSELKSCLLKFFVVN